MRLLGSIVAIVMLVGTPIAAGDNVKQPTTFVCTEAALSQVTFPAEVTVDQIRVDLAAPGGLVKVAVRAGSSERRMTAGDTGARSLRFSPGLRGQTFHIAVDPEFRAPLGACVERVVLLRGGQALAVVQP